MASLGAVKKWDGFMNPGTGTLDAKRLNDLVEWNGQITWSFASFFFVVPLLLVFAILVFFHCAFFVSRSPVKNRSIHSSLFLQIQGIPLVSSTVCKPNLWRCQMGNGLLSLDVGCCHLWRWTTIQIHRMIVYLYIFLYSIHVPYKINYTCM